MSLLGFWPLNGNLKDLSGNGNDLTYVNNSGKLTINNKGKIGKCYQRSVADDGTDLFRSKKKLLLNKDFTMCCWAYVTSAISTANSLITNHNHTLNAGAGITVTNLDGVDYRMACNAGNGTDRIYNTYHGTSNIKNKWCHLLLRFIKSTNKLSLWVNGVKELEFIYPMYPTEEYFEVFSWSTTYSDDLHYRAAALINDVRVYDHALSTKEIKELVKAKILHYKFELSNESTTNYFPHPLTQEYYGGALRAKGSYYMESNGRITVYNQPTGSVLPGCRVDLTTADCVTVSGYSNLARVDIYWAAYTSSNAITTPQTYTYADTDKNGYFETTIWMQNAGVAYMHIGIGDPEGTNYYLDKLMVEKKNHSTEFVSGSRKTDIIRDCSGFGNDAILDDTVCPQWYKDGRRGRGCYNFHNRPYIGAPKYQNIRTINELYIPKQWTMACWIYGMMDQEQGAENTYPIGWHHLALLGPSAGNMDDRFGIIYDTSPTTYESWNSGGYDIYNESWHHVALTYDGNTGLISLYLNGMIIDDNIINNIYNLESFKYFYIGAAWEINYGGHEGYIDDVRVYASALSETDIREIYKNIGSIDEKGSVSVDYLIENDSCYNNQRYTPDPTEYTNISVYAKAYPTDVDSIPYSGIYANNTLLSSYSRDWHISVWDTVTNDWATGINFFGAAASTGAHAIYDVYGEYNSLITGQKQAFIDTLKALTSRYIVIISASHAPEYFDNNMVEQIKRCGGSAAKLSWSGTRNSYICIGKVGCGEGNAYKEVLNNLNSADNRGYSWASVSLNFPKLKTSFRNNGVLSANISEVGITRGLIGWWKLDGNVKDYSINMKDGTIIGTAPIIIDGMGGAKAYSFDGVDDHIKVDSDKFARSGAAELTVSCWAKLGRLAHSTYQVLVSSNTMAGTLYSWMLYQHQADGSLQLFGSSANKSSYIPPLNKWIHIVATVDKSGNYKLYVDNNVVHSGSGFAYTALGGPSVLSIGDAANCVLGALQDVRIYNIALTAEEINTLNRVTGPNNIDSFDSSGKLYLHSQLREV